MLHHYTLGIGIEPSEGVGFGPWFWIVCKRNPRLSQVLQQGLSVTPEKCYSLAINMNTQPRLDGVINMLKPISLFCHHFWKTLKL